MEFAKTIEETRGNTYIRLTFISLIANMYESVIAFTVFFSTLKFSKLISFHKVIYLGVLTKKPLEDRAFQFVYTRSLLHNKAKQSFSNEREHGKLRPFFRHFITDCPMTA